MSNEFIGDNLGKFKLEFEKIRLGIFPDPKVNYMLLSKPVGENYEVKRAKGIGTNMPRSFYWDLYNLKTINLKNEKWTKAPRAFSPRGGPLWPKDWREGELRLLSSEMKMRMLNNKINSYNKKRLVCVQA